MSFVRAAGRLREQGERGDRRIRSVIGSRQRRVLGRPIEADVSLAGLTTLGVGGPARYLARCRGGVELAAALGWARDEGLEVFVLGGGSNLLAADSGFDGLVIQLEDDAVALEPRGDRVRVAAGAGVEWDALVERTVAEGLGGLECLSGIPGRVGAAPMQNVGAYGQEVSETIEAVHVVELATGAAQRIPGARCGFGYRTSRFKGRWSGRYAVSSVDVLLPRRQAGTVRYPELARRLGVAEGGPAPGLAEVRAAVLEIRRGKSMVLDPADPNRRSAGSFFLNPIVAPEQAEEVRRCAGEEMPAFPADGGRVKLSAAWLIERAGFRRGDRLGRAALSSRHVLALVNAGGATAAELIALASKVRRGVRDVFGVTLWPEPVFLGFEEDADALLG